jgi:hypothetical protein
MPGRSFSMTRTISEADWKVFRQLQPIALERFCQQVLEEIEQISLDTARTQHERYLAVYRLIHDRDRELADAFNGPRRSTAWQQLACIQARRLLTEEEMARFSAETREVVQLFLGGE